MSVFVAQHKLPSAVISVTRADTQAVSYPVNFIADMLTDTADVQAHSPVDLTWGQA